MTHEQIIRTTCPKNLEKVIQKSQSFTDALKHLGLPKVTHAHILILKNRVTYLGINYDHFKFK
jgi:hypothetical protein